jgi:hypothetical protein
LEKKRGFKRGARSEQNSDGMNKEKPSSRKKKPTPQKGAEDDTSNGRKLEKKGGKESKGV